MGTIIMGFLDMIKMYKSEWVEVDSRKFESAEVEAINEAVVVASKYGKSVCFATVKGKGFIPLEPLADVQIGDKLEVSKLELVNLKYTGNDPSVVKRDIMRIRVPKKEENIEVSNFANPFGLLIIMVEGKYSLHHNF